MSYAKKHLQVNFDITIFVISILIKENDLPKSGFLLLFSDETIYIDAIILQKRLRMQLTLNR